MSEDLVIFDLRSNIALIMIIWTPDNVLFFIWITYKILDLNDWLDHKRFNFFASDLSIEGMKSVNFDPHETAVPKPRKTSGIMTYLTQIYSKYTNNQIRMLKLSLCFN